MSFYKVLVELPRTIAMTVCARDEETARQAAWEFVATAFSEALRFWDDNEPITDDDGRPLGEVQIELPSEGYAIEPGAIVIVDRQEAQQ